jgi:cyclopropane-fatty-acyl-phospholipid synthase
MSLSSSSSALAVILPSSYADLRAHHILALYGAYRVFAPRVASLLTKSLSSLSEIATPLVYTGCLPDWVLRLGIRWQLRGRLASLQRDSVETELQAKLDIVQELSTLPIAIETAAANQQHYEVPAAFYDLCLGPCKKYSSGYWESPSTTFEESELAMLALYCKRANVTDTGMHIVDLGCGWGSLTLYLAEHFPSTKITSISNSHSQRQYIYATAKQRNLNIDNINVITCDVSNDTHKLLDAVKNNDLVMTVEMFEHMKNYSLLLAKVHGFLKPTGKLFVHIFTHKDYVYHFEDGFMADNFFTGGTMPSDDLLLYFGQDFYALNHWRVNGTHYEKTSNGWLDYLDTSWREGKLQPVLAEAYGTGKEYEWYVNWRLFFLACAELWGLDNGQEWIVSHYLFQRR